MLANLCINKVPHKLSFGFYNSFLLYLFSPEILVTKVLCELNVNYFNMERNPKANKISLDKKHGEKERKKKGNEKEDFGMYKMKSFSGSTERFRRGFVVRCFCDNPPYKKIEKGGSILC